MSDSTTMVAGLSSGFDWRTVIDQLMEIEHRRVDLVQNDKTEYESKLEIFQEINTNLLSFRTQAESLASSDAFNVFATSLSTNSSTYNASHFLSVSTSTSAAPGNHTITMDTNSKKALARQISSKSFTSYNTALDSLDAAFAGGEFVINGRALSVESTDTLADIRDKINNLNTGANATGVTASILTVSSSNYRLILTSDDTGEDAFTILDASADTVNILSTGGTGLGFTDGSTSVKNSISNGFQSEAFSSSTQAVGDMLGLTSAQTGNIDLGTGANKITVNNIDLSSMSLTDIADAINDIAGTNITASVVSNTSTSGVTTYRLKIENTTFYTDDGNVLQTLGLIDGDQGDVAEVHAGTVVIQDSGDTPLSGTPSTLMTDLKIGGSSAGVANGDTITISGTKPDGSAATTTTFTVDTGNADYDRIDDLLGDIRTAFGDTVTATFSSGKITITEDGTGGDSQLEVSLVCDNKGGGTLDFGTISATTEGYTMQTQAGQDAKITIDGTAITSSSNIIDDVIAGVTLNLLTVDNSTTTTINLTVSRDYDTIKSSVQGLLDQYNDVMSDINAQFAYDEETETAGLLQGDGTLRSVKSNLVDIVVSAITGLPSSLNALSLIGITSDDDGNLSIDDDDFKDAFEDNFAGLRRIFVAEGSTTDGDVQYVGHTNDTVAGDYDVNITTAATQAQATGTNDLSGGIASNLSTITVTDGSKTAAVTLDSSDNGSTIDNIVNAVNSELDTEYAQSIMGNVKNTAGDATTAITSSTTWDNVWSDGATAGLLDNNSYEITFTGHKSSGTAVSGSYTISDAGDDTVQGLLSAIEAAYGNEVSAGINTYGYLTITDNTTGNSQLDITITQPESLNFGEVTTSNLVGSVRNTSGAAPGGSAIDTSTKFKAGATGIYGSTLAADGTETIYFSGYTVSGNAVEGSFTIDDAQADQDDVGDFLSAIETAYNAAGGSVTAEIHDGRIVIKDGLTNSTLGIEILEPSGGGVDFGTLSGGVTGRHAVAVTASKDGSSRLVLTHDEYGSSESFTVQLSDTDLGTGAGASDLQDNQAYSGVDVAGTINNEAATGSGQLLTGDAPGSGDTTSVEGLTIKVTLTAAQLASQGQDQGNVKITMGVAELFDRALYDITNVSDGYLDYKIESVADRIDDFETQIEGMEARLDRKMETMINRFVAMELALAKIQNMSDWLTGQVNAVTRGWV